MNWHQKDIKETIEVLKSSSDGLSSAEADKRLQQYGPNEIKEIKKRTLFMMFLDQFRDFMIIVLIAAAVISGIIGEMVDTLAIVVIITLNAIIGFVQEYRAEQAMKALKRMAAPSAIVLRDAQPITVPSAELVPGDIVLLEAGRIDPAAAICNVVAKVFFLLTLDRKCKINRTAEKRKTNFTKKIKEKLHEQLVSTRY